MQYRLERLSNLLAALVKVSAALVFYILAHRASTYSLLHCSALPQVLRCAKCYLQI